MESASRPKLSRNKVIAFGAITVFLGLAVGFGFAEMAVRKANPRPPVQIVRGQNLHLIGDIPVWEWSTDRLPRACAEAHPERKRILFLGSSITHGFSMPAEQVFTVELERRLNELRPNPGFCVMNFAQPGFTSQQKVATGSVEVPKYQPALVLWEGWNEFGKFVPIGDAAYELRGYVQREDGFPGLWFVPDSINHLLFLHSRFYEYLTLREGEKLDQSMESDAEVKAAKSRLDWLYSYTGGKGIPLVVYQTPRLDRPFKDEPSPPHNELLDEFAAKYHVPTYMIRKELIDEDYLKLRIDDCCHFSPEGHKKLVGVFERIVLEMLDGKPNPKQ